MARVLSLLASFGCCVEAGPWVAVFMAELRFFGHNCIRIKAREAVILTDPVGRNTGYAMPKQTADIVTLSHQHEGHTNLAAVKPEFRVVNGPGEYEMHDVFITGIRTYHDAEKGKLRGYNTAYIIEVEGMKIGHLGDLGHTLSEEQAELMSDSDVLIVPAGGGTVVTPEQAADVVAQLGPKLVIPVQYATANGDRSLGTLDAFAKLLGVEIPAPEEKLTVRSSDLGETLRFVVLAPESEAVKR